MGLVTDLINERRTMVDLRRGNYDAWIQLLCLRCGYVSLGVPGVDGLTEKGRGVLGAKFWRRYNSIKCKTDKRHRKAVMDFLASLLPAYKAHYS